VWRLGAAWGSVPTATHLAGDDGRTKGLLCSPIGGVEIRIDEKAKERREFRLKMACEPLDVVDRVGNAQVRRAAE
jgi:hypothetical protein